MDFDSEVLRFAAQSNERIEKMFNDYFDELAAIGIKTPKDSGVFSFEKDVPPQYREKVDQLTKSFQERLYNEIHAGVDVAYGISLAKHTALLSALFPEGLNVHQPRRKDAREAFIAQRTKPNGRLSLSDRVWNYTNQGKAEVEAAMSLAIEDGVVQGKTAAELGRSLRKYLNDPDRMYRRYHKMVVDSEGAKRDVVVWKKRVMGADGKVHFIDADLEYVGQGVYRSARANAERCSRSEINGAYRYADYERWNDEEFVIGIKISLSNNHTVKQEMKVGKRHVTKAVPFHDICDDLQGIYPKTFKWAGWHPQCRCHATAVTASKEERLQWLAEGCPPGFFDKKYIKNAPPQMVRWLNENLDKVQRAKSLPYWIQDNLKLKRSPKGEEKIVSLFGVGMKKPAAMLMAPSKLTPLEIAAQRHAARTPQEAREIQARWNKRKNDRTKEELRSLLASVEKNDFTKKIKHDIGQLYIDKRTGLYHAGKVEDIKRRLKIAQAATERHKTRDAAAIQEAWTNSRKKSIAQIAKERHDARTPEYIAELTKKWEDHKKQTVLIRKTADNVLNVANHPYIDTTKLQELRKGGELKSLQAETKRVAKELADIKKWEKQMSSVISDVNTWTHKFSKSEIQGVFDAVNKTFARWNFDFSTQNSIDFLKNKLTFEMSIVQQKKKYNTWEIAYNAYKERLELVIKREKMLNIKQLIDVDLQTIKASRSSKLKQIAAEFETLFKDNNTDISVLQKKADEVKKSADALAKARQRVASKTAAASGSQVQTGVMTEAQIRAEADKIFGGAQYTITNGAVDIDIDMHKKLANASMPSDDDRKKIYGHMGGRYVRTTRSFTINGALRDVQGKGKNRITGKVPNSSWKIPKDLYGQTLNDKDIQTIVALDKAIDRGKLTFPINLNRFVGSDAIVPMFGGIKDTSVAGLSKHIGKMLDIDCGFMSVSTDAKKNVFTGRPFLFKIHLPQGTPIFFSENYMESEAILGRCTKLLVRGVSKNAKGTTVIDVVVVP